MLQLFCCNCKDLREKSFFQDLTLSLLDWHWESSWPFIICEPLPSQVKVISNWFYKVWNSVSTSELNLNDGSKLWPSSNQINIWNQFPVTKVTYLVQTVLLVKLSWYFQPIRSEYFSLSANKLPDIWPLVCDRRFYVISSFMSARVGKLRM